ncbi:MAG: hypothetical protein M1829_004598 [Trizodia sp. TS-e1964]|nr:MAG: hypothetical protein M1829_004598 [Trizodia sp. TS-e1964]
MAKDKKTSVAKKKARVADKQTKKATQRDQKVKKKGLKDDYSDAEDVDLDALLADYAKQQEQFVKVTETACEPPSPRSSATIIGSPSNANELFLFGGEHYNGSLATFFNHLFVYLIDRNQFRLITSPNTPLPRSGHAWCRGGNAGGIYIFGGEFSSPKQGTFYHYNDFWRLDPPSREWTRLEGKGKSPPARSGHRMTYFKHYILLFGGFQDTSQNTKYLSDLWVYDCQKFIWHNPIKPIGSQSPDARSSFSFLPHDSGAVLFGGYSRVKSTGLAGKSSKGSGQGVKTAWKPVIHQDTWFLRIHPPAEGSAPTAPPTIRWERRKRPANIPLPARAGATMVYHKGRGISFGGVHDVEESEEGIESEFFNGLFAWNIERNRYFPLILRRPKQLGKKQQQQGDRNILGRRERGKADEEELLRNLAALETRKIIIPEGPVKLDLNQGDNNDPLTAPSQAPLGFEMPHPRFNAQLAVQDDVLFIFGGTYERGPREFTFDELWCIDLGKLDGIKQLYHRDVENWEGSDDDDEDNEDNDDEGDGDSEDARSGPESETGEAGQVEVEDEKATPDNCEICRSIVDPSRRPCDSPCNEDHFCSPLLKADPHLHPHSKQSRLPSAIHLSCALDLPLHSATDRNFNCSPPLRTEPKPLPSPAKVPKEALSEELADADTTELTSDSGAQKTGAHPRPFETLRDFYHRTAAAWQDDYLVLQGTIGATQVQALGGKEARKGAFEMAEQKWWECREEVRQMEDELEEGGIGEVVSITDKGVGGGGGPTKRR